MFNLKASKIILTSELYSTKKEQPYFVLKARNPQVIGMSEMHASKAATENGIASVKKNGPCAAIADNT